MWLVRPCSANRPREHSCYFFSRTAFTKRGDRLEEVPVEELAVEDVVVVKPGERVPVERKPGDDVFAGTINQDNALDVRMTRLARDNTLARVMQLVAEAQEQKSPTQRFTETLARCFVPAVLIGTLFVIVLLPLVLGWTWSASFYRGMLRLVAASPCALAIGTPAAVLAGIA